MFAPQIIKIYQFFQVTSDNVGDSFWRIFVYFNAYSIGSYFPR